MTLPTAGNEPSCKPVDGLELEHVCFSYDTRPILRDVSLTMPSGSYLTLLGPSGCGKSTLLRVIAGYLEPQQGTVRVGGRDVTTLAPQLRDIGMVFQSYALFPHLTAWENIAFGLTVRGTARSVIRERVTTLMRRVGLTLSELERRPHRLSGGQQQRVALARALAINPPLLLLDEPLANLDRHLRMQVREELAHIHRESGVTTVMVTHDQEEALAGSDLIGIMSAGELLQVGTPRDLYEHPRTPFVARFLGDANLVPGHYLGRSEKEMYLIRPEQIVPSQPDSGQPDASQRDSGQSAAGQRYCGRVLSLDYHGADVVATLQMEPANWRLRIRTRSHTPWPVGAVVGVDWPDVALWKIPDAENQSTEYEAELDTDANPEGLTS